MKHLIVIVCLVCATGAFAKGGPIPIQYTGLTYNGPGGVESVTGTVANVLTNYLWSDVPIPPETVLVKITNPGNKSCKIQPADKSSDDTIALVIEGGPKKIQIDFGQSKGQGVIPYMYVEGNPGKILFKGLAGNVRRVVIYNEDDARGVHLQNISKGKGKDEGGGFTDIIIMDKLKRAQSNHGGFGGPDDANPGIIMIGEDSSKGQIKASPKGEIANVLICKSFDTNVFANFQAAYADCIASNEILAGIEMGELKMINTKALGPAVIAVDVDKKYKPKQVGKRIKITDPVVGLENITE